MEFGKINMENFRNKYFAELSEDFKIDSPFKKNLEISMNDKHKDIKYISAIMKNCTTKSLSKIKDNIIDSRKPKMRIVKQYLCDCCDKNISKPSEGFVIQGNIYVADPNISGGLIGDNFPEPDDKNSINMDAVKHTVLCRECFCRALGLVMPDSKYNIKKKDSNYYW